MTHDDIEANAALRRPVPERPSVTALHAYRSLLQDGVTWMLCRVMGVPLDEGGEG